MTYSQIQKTNNRKLVCLISDLHNSKNLPELYDETVKKTSQYVGNKNTKIF